MEKVLSREERIRRAEEIYARRQNLRERTKKATVSVSQPKNFRLLKKLALQIIICAVIYYIFYLINTTSYSFSQDTLSKTDELISHDFDFYSVYNSFVNWANSYIYGNENKDENQNAETTQTEAGTEDKAKAENMMNTENTQDIVPPEETLNEDESLTQNEVSMTEESETERIKNKYSFIKPTERRNFIRIWDKRSYSRCSNSIP